MKVYARNGDTLWYFSQMFGVPLELIIDSNLHANPTMLKIGEEIKIPGYETVPYRIKSGDTLWKLAAQKNLAIDAIMIVNPQMVPPKLHPGDPFFLPKRISIPCIQTTASCDYKKFSDMIGVLKNIYPFITVNTIGKSVLGRSIQELRVGKGRKKVHINSSFHANEWITTLILMRLLNTYLLLLTNGGTARQEDPLMWYHNIELSLVPMVNPDGVDLVLNGPPIMERDKVIKINSGSEEFVHWKANIRGVDLNKQYPANWEIDKKKKAPLYPAPRDYPGSAPLTEPEAIAMADLAKRNHFNYCIAFHTQGEEFYWGYEGHEPPESVQIAKEFEKKSGYKAIQYIDSHGGYKDWFLQEFKRPAFTIELGRGINPLPLSQFDDILKKVEGIFLTILSL
jgi:g-D-glutamyl-meso-diaminopimelate peptidase